MSPTTIPVVILAGGKSSRLKLNGLYKWQLPFGEQSLLQYVIAKLNRQSNTLLLNAPPGKEKSIREISELPILFDRAMDFQGPLAGLHRALLWAKEQQHSWVSTVSCDTPFLPSNLLAKLAGELTNSHKLATVVCSRSQVHPTIGLWSTELFEPLDQFLDQQNSRSLIQWSANYVDLVDFPCESDEPDPFFNINSANDYHQALSRLANQFVNDQ